MTLSTHIKTKQLLVILFLPILLGACAINDSGNKIAATAPPITLNAPPALVLEGNCEITGQLEQWLQVTVPNREKFQSRLDEAAAKNAADVHDDTLYLAALRDTVANTHTPDCGVEVQSMLTTAMAEAVDVVQAYFNRTLAGDLNTALIKPIKELGKAAAIQNELIVRMKNQYQLENTLTPPPTG